MNKKTYIFLILICSVVGISQLHSYTSGSDVGFTGSKGDGGLTCTYCHQNSIDATNQFITINTNIPATGWLADSTYMVEVTVNGTNPMNPSANTFGFMATIERSSDDRKLGVPVLINTAETQIKNAFWVTHKAAGTTGDDSVKTWKFLWKAPNFGTDSVNIYACGNVANGSGFRNDVILPNMKAWQADSTNPKIANSTSLNAYMPKINVIQNNENLVVNSEVTLKSIQIYSLEGKLLHSISNIYENNYNANIQGFEKGIYVISVNKLYNQKFIIL